MQGRREGERSARIARSTPATASHAHAELRFKDPSYRTSSSSLHIQFNRQKSPYQLMTRFGSEELVRYEGSLNRSSAWACEAVAGVERAIRALLSPPRRPCTARAAFNLATTWRCCVAVRAMVKPLCLEEGSKTHRGRPVLYLCLFSDVSHTAI